MTTTPKEPLMTTPQLVALMNELSCLSSPARSAVLRALRESTPEAITRAVEASPDYVAKFVEAMFDDGVPVLYEAPLWLHVLHAHGVTVDLTDDAGADPLADLVALEADEERAAADAADKLTAAVDADARFEANVADAAAKQFRVVRLKDGVVTGHVTRVQTRDECLTYLRTKGTPAMALIDVTTGQIAQ